MSKHPRLRAFFNGFLKGVTSMGSIYNPPLIHYERDDGNTFAKNWRKVGDYLRNAMQQEKNRTKPP